MLHKLFLIIFISICSNIAAQNKIDYKVVHYDEYDGLSQRFISQIVQGDDGYIWIGTWDGLHRFDGYEFINMKSCNMDENQMPSDRFVDMVKNSTGNLWCLIDTRLYLFDTHIYKYTDVLTALENKIGQKLFVTNIIPTNTKKTFVKCKDGKYIELNDTKPFTSAKLCKKVSIKDERYELGQRTYNESELKGMNSVYSFTDDAGNDWLRSNYGIYKLIPKKRNYENYPFTSTSQIRCLFKDKMGRMWITSKYDKTVMILDKTNKLIGYLCHDGTISKNYTSFGASVYSIFQDSSNRFWLGCKPEGLFVLEDDETEFKIRHIKNEKTVGQFGVYDIKEDRKGRIWIASFEKGLLCYSKKEEDLSHKLKYPHNSCSKVRQLLITPKQELLVATTEGMLIADISKDNVSEIKFHKHVKELNRKNSLSNNSTMSFLCDHNKKYYVCTESGGLNRIDSKNLLDEELNFTHYNTSNGLSSDIAISAIEHNKKIWIVSNNQIIALDLHTGHSSAFDAHFFKSKFHFSESVPLYLSDGRYIFGLEQGAIILNLDTLKKSAFKPKIAITSISIQNKKEQISVNYLDTITLGTEERSLTVKFAALDYSAENNLKYAFCLNNNKWNELGENHSATFLDLKPGIYLLKLRSTNHDGVWVNNERLITIVVKPAWWETIYAKIIYILLCLCFAYSIYRVILYIRLIKIHERNLEVYLQMMLSDTKSIEEDNNDEMFILEKAQIRAVDNMFMKRVLAFIEEHLSDSDINISDMAEAAATSKAGLNRKLKTLLGITPNEFLREVRIQKACTLLKDPSISINDIAYICGFSDAKYFSRVFKAKKSLSPSEYRAENL